MMTLQAPSTAQRPATRLVRALLLAAGLCLAGGGAVAQTCTEAQIAAARDAGSSALRRHNAQTLPQIEAKVRDLQKSRGWSDHDLDEKAYEQLEDDTIRAFDRETSTLITRTETLGEASSGLPVCERLLEMRQTVERMREVAQQKSRYLIAKLDRELGGATANASPAAPRPAPEARPEPKVGSKPAETGSGWTTSSKGEPSTGPAPLHSGGKSAAPSTVAQAPQPPAPASPTPRGWEPPPPLAEPITYSRDEVFAAGQGLFGKVSSGLASVLDFAFQKAGRPAGYIIGDEGGGAFLAGVRYGEGLLHMKGRRPEKVYWRGPSIGYDIGAAGSRMMVLVYNVRDPEELFASFAGVDGSAYLVGGVGMTFLTNGRKAMAPIRSGLGLRFGANVGYLKFSHKPSWNPF